MMRIFDLQNVWQRHFSTDALLRAIVEHHGRRELVFGAGHPPILRIYSKGTRRDDFAIAFCRPQLASRTAVTAAIQ